ncbi:MAG: right-handed parallel beta-helix repeat-containing protein [Thermoguttaceae bacterium]|nr:right-handed parallel beta-helix repeat-containing protein [Thermoguttaceae bacterium]MDW8079195.1 hypothetical protein [Thermoguttaceae bacterium]
MKRHMTCQLAEKYPAKWAFCKLMIPLAFVVFCLATPGASIGADWYVSPQGIPEGAGTQAVPWDIASALDGRQPVQPGDTIWLAGGTYRHPDRSVNSPGFVIRLKGEKDRPIHIRPLASQRVIIDGGLSVQSPSDYLWIWDLEILVSENFTLPRRVEEPGSHPKSYGRPWGGLNIHAGTGCKYIHLVIHDCAQGVSFWRGATDSELYGCIIYDNGWDAPDRGHGHAIYTQNEIGIKTIADCIMTGGFSHTMHAYGSPRAFVHNYLIEGNIAYNAGRFLVGGEGPAKGIRVLSNCLYRVNMQIGYTAPQNEDCEVRDNVIIHGGLSIIRFKNVISENNLIIPSGQTDLGDRPPIIHLRKSRYDPRRAHLAIFNPQKAAQVAVNFSNFLRPGEEFELRDPRDFFGPPVYVGKVQDDCTGWVPVHGEFGAYVILRRSN